MISSVSGIIEDKGTDYVEINLGVIGVKILTSQRDISLMPKIGESTKLYTFLKVKEDDMQLYGFITKESVEMFILLISVSGVGPRSALSILSTLTPHDIYESVNLENVTSLQVGSGVGKKLAQKIILELKDKISSINTVPTDTPSLLDPEVITALLSLGYTRTEAMKAIRSIDNKDLTLEEKIRASLNKLSNP